MTKKGFVNDGSITLDDACTMEQVAGLHALLAQRFAALAGMPAPAEGVRLDMSRVTAIDACGCQILALFLERVRRLGIAATADGAGDEVRERIELLGFSSLFSGKQQQP